MASGRKTGGRKKGTRNVKTTKRLAVIEQATDAGIAPIDVMLQNMRHFHKIAGDAEAVLEGLTAEQFVGVQLEPAEQFKALLAEVKKAAGLRQMAQECARDAAPYCHPRLAALALKGGDGKDLTVESLLEAVDGRTRGLPNSS